MKLKLIVIILTFSFNLAVAQSSSSQFLIGFYGLQSPVGTQGFNTGHLDEIVDELNSAQKGGINVSIPYRSWNRIKYPHWDFFGFVKNYMSDMYKFTKMKPGKTGIQTLTPPLYAIFLLPPISNTPEDDRGNDRKLDKRLFRKFVKEILNKEISLVIENTTNDSVALSILLNQRFRPLGGWYLDDEPLVRNHDIEVLEDMANIIKSVEEDYFYSHEIFRDVSDEYMTDYLHPIFIAFDGDDLHNYKNSGRPKDAKTYNYNGVQYSFPKDKKYTIFSRGTLDVILVDFYHQDIKFWGKIINDIHTEIEFSRRSLKVIPVVKVNHKKTNHSKYSVKYFNNLFSFLANQKIDGIWMYQWNTNKNDTYAGKDIWLDQNVNLSDLIKNIFSGTSKLKIKKKSAK